MVNAMVVPDDGLKMIWWRNDNIVWRRDGQLIDAGSFADFMSIRRQFGDHIWWSHRHLAKKNRTNNTGTWVMLYFRLPLLDIYMSTQMLELSHIIRWSHLMTISPSLDEKMSTENSSAYALFPPPFAA